MPFTGAGLGLVLCKHRPRLPEWKKAVAENLTKLLPTCVMRKTALTETEKSIKKIRVIRRQTQSLTFLHFK